MLFGVWLPYAAERHLVRAEALRRIEDHIRHHNEWDGRVRFPDHLWVTPRGTVVKLRRAPVGVAFELRANMDSEPFASGTTFTARGFLGTVDYLTRNHSAGPVTHRQVV